MKIVCISDTHTLHLDMKHQIPEGDVLIHAGDVSLRGTQEEIELFLSWYNDLPHKHKIFIAGNHDFFFDTKWAAITKTGQERHKKNVQTEEKVKSILDKYTNIVYLNDNGIEIDGVKFWGSPITPWFHDWAFNRTRDEKIQEHWDLIPKDTNVLITHGPVYKIMDKVYYGGENVGCENLLKTIPSLTELKLHVCGHIHETYGVEEKENVKYVNASICTLQYKPINKPIVIEI